MRIEQSVINEIKEKTDILDLVSEYVKLEKRGRNYIGLCPFHDEKTPSFTVSEDKQICHCFGCKKGGNVFQFIQDIKDISFVEAVQELGERVNIKVDIGHSNPSTTLIASEDLKMIELIKSRGIGYAPNNAHFCHDFLQQKGYDIELAYEAGLLSRNEENFSYYDRFRDRIMFPLKNAQGRIVGFSGRTYNNQEPKYLNSPETPIFQKRRLLYNLDSARKSIRKNDEVMLLEGFMDVIKADYAGLKTVVASMGTALSEDHITVLKKLTSNITLMFDGDFAGQEAILKTGEHLLKHGLNVFVVQLPKNMDPDEYIVKFGKEKFIEFINNEKKSFIIYKVQFYRDEIENNDLAYERHFKEITEDLSFVRSSILKNKIVNDVADIFNIDANTIMSNVHQQPEFISYEEDYIGNTNDNSNLNSQNLNIVFTHLNKSEKAQRALLKHFMMDKDVFLNYNRQLEANDFTNKYFQSIFKVLTDYYSENDYYSISDLILYIEDKDIREAYDLEIEEYISTLNENKYEDSIEELNHKLKEALRIGDVESQKYYLQMIVNKNKQRM